MQGFFENRYSSDSWWPRSHWRRVEDTVPAGMVSTTSRVVTYPGITAKLQKYFLHNKRFELQMYINPSKIPDIVHKSNIRRHRMCGPAFEP